VPISPKVVFLSAGEASGDAYAAALVNDLKAKGLDARFEGIGGPQSLEAGVRLVTDSSEWGAIGIAEALRRVPWILLKSIGIFRHLKKSGPGLFVAIDFGFGNIRLARFAKKHGWKVLYLVPPGSWRRNKQGKDLPEITDAIVTPFEWSAEILKGMGANVFWFGHPLKQLVAARRRAEGERTSLAVLPGSRHHEVDANLPLLAKVVEGWEGQVEFGIAPSLSPDEIRSRWKTLTGRDDLFTHSDTIGVLLRARAGLICSGTATLEAALCECPMVVFYELTPVARKEARLRMIPRPKFIALPNILLDREVVPEHVSLTPLDPRELRGELDEIWADSSARQAQLDGFLEIDEIAGGDDAISRAADLAISMIAS
jgi:lipid-A-disaccharide synthase